MSQPLRVLFIEDSVSDMWLGVRRLESAGYEVEASRVETVDGLRGALASPAMDVIIADYHLPRFDAATALAMVRETGLDVPFLVVSGAIGEERAVALMKAGAQDCIMKDNLARLPAVVEREIRDATARRQLRRAEAEQQKMEEQLRQAQKMESIGRLAGAVAHDFNNMLTIITGYAQMGMSEPGLPEEIHDSFLEIDQAARRASDLARRLLMFSRPQPSSPRDILLNDLIRDFRKMLARLLGERIRLEVSLDGDAGFVHADPGHIEQVLMNLAVNARDAMPEGGRLTIRTAWVPDTNHVQISVADTGIGMSPEVKTRIFEPFFTTKGEGKGTGLGLATVYGIVKQSQGHIEVVSEPGHGATFILRLPRKHDGEPTQHQQDDPSAC